ncbi:hemolysin family protein [Sphingomonas baiyangensis]|uniref:HlyC/CorC family transporter n=1 Tax=Sphingomonas baiyangensis TaxID=2572576 RepID=A0A4U1L0W0_9SPHN|nr:hemolysin family protein [Sphingomonas baiyangensis]TKD50417.1 HlyC/CorC family transporter [Sphingomonas baiyangensis]
MMVAANALYVAAEFATVGSRKSRVQESAEGGNRAAAKLLAILRDPKRLDNYVAGCQIGITVSSLVAGAYGQAALTPLLTPVLGPIGGQAAAVVAVLIFVTVVQVVFGELLPKTIALRYPERLAMGTMLPMRASLVVFKPLIWLFNGTAFALMRLFRLNGDHSHMHVHSPQELEALYRDSAAGGLIDADERDMLSGALHVDERLVRAIMTPRTRMVTVAASETVGDAILRVAETPYSRFPVTGENRDDVVGVVHLRSLFAAYEKDPATLVAAIQRAPLIVADVMSVPRLWETLRAKGRRSAMVINEYGSFAGLVTLEDALEEVFGEVQDEFDDEEELVIEQDGELSVRGDVTLSMLADRHAVVLPDDRADTISGLAWHEFGRLPLVGDERPIAGTQWRMRIEAMEGYAVRRVRLIDTPTAPDEAESEL